MQICKNRKYLVAGILLVLLCILSAIGIWKTVYYSADIDESYALTMAVRLANGERLFVDMWEPHQMSAVLYAPIVALYKGITGSMEGALVFMRFFGVFVQGVISVWLYRSLRKDMSLRLSIVLAFAYFNFTPKHIQSPEFTLLFYWGMMALMLSLLGFFRSNRKRYGILAGLSVSGLVLCYPAAVLVFVYVLVWFIWQKKNGNGGISALWYFAGTCVACGAIFLIYVLYTGGGFGVFSNISNILMDESHDQSLAYLLESHIKGLWEMLKIIVPVIVLCHVGRPVFCRKVKRDFCFLSVLLFFTGAYAIYQFHTITEVNFMVFYPIVVQIAVVEWYAYATFEKTEKDRLYFSVSLPLNFMGFVAVLLMSNLPTGYSVSFLMPGVILGVWQIYRVYGEAADAVGETAAKENTAAENRIAENMTIGKIWRFMAICLLICVVSQMFVARICLVRFTATQRKNIFETYHRVEEGVLKGIRLGNFDYEQYEIKRELLEKYVEAGDRLLYIGADMFLYSQLQRGQIATGNTISTPAFSTQLMCYYEKHPEKMPTVVFVDREYGADFSVILEQELMKAFMEEHFDMEKAVSEPAVTVYKREP